MPVLPAAVEVAAFRIASEAMTNAARHSGATRCRVTIAVNGSFEATVADNGRGTTQSVRRGVGWTSMQERAAELGGTCTISSRRPGAGLVVRAALPCEQQAGEQTDMEAGRDPTARRRRPPRVPPRARPDAGRHRQRGDRRPRRDRCARPSSCRAALPDVHPDGSADARPGWHRGNAPAHPRRSRARDRRPRRCSRTTTRSSRRCGRRAGLSPQRCRAGRDVRAIHAAGAGEAIFGPEIARRVVAHFASGAGSTTTVFPVLTDREREVLEMIAAGKGNATIAHDLDHQPQDGAQPRVEQLHEAAGLRQVGRDRQGPSVRSGRQFSLMSTVGCRPRRRLTR